MKLTVKAWFNDEGKRTGWAIWEGDNHVVDIWPTKRQALEWIKRAEAQA